MRRQQPHQTTWPAPRPDPAVHCRMAATFRATGGRSGLRDACAGSRFTGLPGRRQGPIGRSTAEWQPKPGADKHPAQPVAGRAHRFPLGRTTCHPGYPRRTSFDCWTTPALTFRRVGSPRMRNPGALRAPIRTNMIGKAQMKAQGLHISLTVQRHGYRTMILDTVP